MHLTNDYSIGKLIINKPNEIIDEVQESLFQWPEIAKECGVRNATIKRIQAKLLQLKD